LLNDYNPQRSDDLSPVFAMSPFTKSPCRKCYILRSRMLLWFLVKRWLRTTETVRSES